MTGAGKRTRDRGALDPRSLWDADVDVVIAAGEASFRA
jgi:hypothetical protein